MQDVTQLREMRRRAAARGEAEAVDRYTQRIRAAEQSQQAADPNARDVDPYSAQADAEYAIDHPRRIAAGQERDRRGSRLRADLTDFARDPIGYAGSRMVGTAARTMQQPVNDVNPARAFAEAAPAGQLAVQGTTFGYGDELMGGAAALGAAASGGDAGNAYRQNRDVAQSEMSENRRAAPGAAMLAEGLGGLAIAPILPGAGFVAQGSTRVGTTARAGLLGGGYGAVVGSGEAEGGLRNRAIGAAIGAPIGAVLGAGSPLVIEGVVKLGATALRTLSTAFGTRAAGGRLTGAEARVWNTLLDDAESAGMTEQQILSRFDELRAAGLSHDETMGEILGPLSLIHI